MSFPGPVGGTVKTGRQTEMDAAEMLNSSTARRPPPGSVLTLCRFVSFPHCLFSIHRCLVSFSLL